MKIKDELVLQGMTQVAVDEIEYNTMGAFQTSGCNTHGYYIVKWCWEKTGGIQAWAPTASATQKKITTSSGNPP